MKKTKNRSTTATQEKKKLVSSYQETRQKKARKSTPEVLKGGKERTGSASWNSGGIKH